MSEEPGTYALDRELTPNDVRNLQYIYHGLRERPDPALGLPERCQMPDCRNGASRTLTVKPVKLVDVEMEIVMCDEHADGFYEEGQQ